MKQFRGFGDLVRIEPLEVRLCLTAGGLDPAFGQGGMAMTDVRGAATEIARAVAIQSDGKVVIAGSANGHEDNLLLSRFLPSGAIDTSFGQKGIVLLDTPISYTSAYDYDVALDSTGRILVLARIDYNLTLLRYKPDGSVDTSFGHAGQVLIDDYSSIDPIASLRLTAGGKILVGEGHNDAFVYRFNPDGSADRSFGESGMLTVDFGESDSFLGLELRPDGSFVVGGTVERYGANRHQDIALARFTAAGQADLSFARTGRVVGMIFPVNSIVEHFALSADGRPVFSAVSDRGFSVARFRASGVFDRAFGVRGIASVAVPGTYHDGLALAAAPGGGIVVVGKSAGSGEGTREPNRIFVARLTATGAADTSFGDAGLRVIVTSPDNSNDTLEAVTIDPGGAVFAAGAEHGDALVLKLTPAGAPDGAFGVSGQTSVASLLAIDESIQTMARTPDGKIVVAASGRSQVLARYLSTGALDTTFGQGGYVVIPPGILDGDFQRISIDALGRIFAIATNYYKGCLVRFTASGAFDANFGEKGVVQLEFPAFCMLLLDGGKMLIAGEESENPASVQLLKSDGSVDRTFGNQGTVSIPRFDVAADLLRQPDGKLIVVGDFTFEQGGQRYFGATRLMPDGKTDTSFGDGGVTNIAFTDYRGALPMDAILAPDGRILITGPDEYYSTSDFAVTRLTKDGKLDATFGDNGRVVTDFPPDFVMDFGIDTDIPRGIAIDTDGKIVVTGVADVAPLVPFTDGPADETQPAIAIARYSPDGTLDNTFGDGGQVVTRIGLSASANAMLILPGHRLLVAGNGQSSGSNSDLVLAQYLLDDPNPVTAQVTNNVLWITGSPRADMIRLRKENGRIVVFGVAGSFDPATFSAIAIEGGAGDDVIDLSNATVPLTINGGDGNDSILGGIRGDAISGGNGNDTLFGGGNNDTLRGGDGNDYLNGGPGADQVLGEKGNDQIFAVDGLIDSLDGGDGFDRYKSDTDDLLAQMEASR